MAPARWLLLVRTALCAAIFASAALVIDYRNLADATFCGVESACFKVRSSDVGQKIADQIHELIPGATLPAVAFPVFAAILALTLFVGGKWMVRLLAAVTTAGALAALGLIYVQFSIDALCPYCMVVDVAILAAAVGSLAIAARIKTDEDAQALLGSSMATPVAFPMGVAGAIVSILPFVFAEFPDVDPLPEPIAKLQEPGKLTIVSFTDFECPHCRNLYPTLKDIKTRDDVVFHRYMVPLAGHKGAMPAALAYVCTPEEQRDRIAETLYTVPSEQLGYENVVKLAVLIAGVDEPKFRECMTSAEANDRVAADKKLFDDLGLSGLPTTYVGPRPIRGAAADKVLVAARTAGAGLELPPWTMVLLACAVVAAAAARSHRRLAAAPATVPPGDDPRPNEDESSAEPAADEEPAAEAKLSKKKKAKRAASKG